MDLCSFCKKVLVRVNLPVMHFIAIIWDDLVVGCALEIFWKLGSHMRFYFDHGFARESGGSVILVKKESVYLRAFGHKFHMRDWLKFAIRIFGCSFYMVWWWSWSGTRG